MNTQNKELDFEVNLLPVLSVLSICICFLLTTAVWNRMGYIGVNQAIGDDLQSSEKSSDSLILKIQSSGYYLIQWKKGDDSSIISEKRIKYQPSNSLSIESIKKELTKFILDSRVKTVVVMPEVGIKYGHTIQLMDHLKSLSLSIGLAPAIETFTKGKGAKI